MAADAFRTQGRGGRGVQGAKLKEEDLVTHIIHTTAHAYLLFFSNRGRVYRLKAHEIPMKERTARGTAIVNLLPLAPDERIQAIIDTRDYDDDRFLFFATKEGPGQEDGFSEYDKSRREGFIAINLKDGDELVQVIQTSGDDDIFMVSRNGMTIRFTEDDVRPMGRSAAGVRGMRMRGGDEVVSCDVARDDVDILIVTDAGYGKRTQLDKFNRQGRGHDGRQGHQAHRPPGLRGGGVHGRPRRRDLPDLLGRRHHPHAGPRHLVAGPRRHRRPGHEPRRRPDGPQLPPQGLSNGEGARSCVEENGGRRFR